MKKIVIILLLMLNAVFVYSQKYHSEKTNALVFWGSGGYNRFDNTLNETKTLGGGGGEIGIGYEFGTSSSGFLFQTGISASYLSSSMLFTSEITENKRMYDTERNEHIAYFNFHNISEKDNYLNLNYTLLFGYQSYNGFYVLGGPKVAYAVAGAGTTTCEVTRKSRYDGLVGEDGNGLLSGMPNHDMDNVQRKHKQEINNNPYIGLSVECGYTKLIRHINNNARTDYHSLRIACFCDFGGYINTNRSSNTSLIINQANDGQYQPTIANYLYSNQSFLTGLFCGIKFTYLLQWTSPVCVICQ